jgi:hypothetical protein
VDSGLQTTSAGRRRQGCLGFLAALGLTMTSAGTSSATPPAAEGADAAHGAPDRAACVSAYREAQELKKAGKLVEAGKKLVICASASCPGPIIADCGTWTGELQESTPSVVFEVEVDGHVPSAVKVSVDDLPISDWSHAVLVNPGAHVVRVEVPSFDPYVEKVIMAEGHRMRLVSVKFATPKPAAPPPSTEAPIPAEPRRPVPIATYPLLGVGIVGLAGFGVFDGLGRAKQTDLENSCKPHCSDSNLRPMKTDYLIGDIGLGVGLASLAAAAIVYFTRGEEKPSSTPAVSLQLGSVGADGPRGNPWGAEATMRW